MSGPTSSTEESAVLVACAGNEQLARTTMNTCTSLSSFGVCMRHLKAVRGP